MDIRSKNKNPLFRGFSGKNTEFFTIHHVFVFFVLRLKDFFNGGGSVWGHGFSHFFSFRKGKVRILKNQGLFRQHIGTFILLNLSILFFFCLSTASAHTWTATAGATIDTVTKKFGAGSVLFATTADDVTTGDSADFEPTADFTWEAWVYPLANAINGTMTHIPSGNFGLGWALYNGVGAPRPYVSIGNAACNDWLYSGNSTASTLSLTAWHHLVLWRTGNHYYMGLDGTAVLILDTSEDPCAPSGSIYLGDQDANGNGITGNMDDVRFSNVARYPDSTTYTVPTEAFCYDANTVTLLHFDTDTSEDTVACAAGGATYRQPDIFIITGD